MPSTSTPPTTFPTAAPWYTSLPSSLPLTITLPLVPTTLDRPAYLTLALLTSYLFNLLFFLILYFSRNRSTSPSPATPSSPINAVEELKSTKEELKKHVQDLLSKLAEARDPEKLQAMVPVVQDLTKVAEEMGKVVGKISGEEKKGDVGERKKKEEGPPVEVGRCGVDVIGPLEGLMEKVEENRKILDENLKAMKGNVESMKEVRRKVVGDKVDMEGEAVESSPGGSEKLEKVVEVKEGEKNVATTLDA